MGYIRQHIPLRPPVNRRGARGAAETFGLIRSAMEQIVPLVPNAMFVDHAPPPPPKEEPVIRARDVVDVDTLCDGLTRTLLREELLEFDLIDLD